MTGGYLVPLPLAGGARGGRVRAGRVDLTPTPNPSREREGS